MVILRIILAGIAVALLALRPRSGAAALGLAGVAGCDLALGATVGSAVGVVAPLLAFLGAALTLARFVERSGLAERAACALAASARGSALALYALVCLLCGALTAAVSLDAAVVLMVPLLVVLADRFGAPARPLFLGVVAVANVASIAVPQGNPTNLVLIQRLHLSALAFVAHMLVPGLAAAALCAGAVALSERRALSARYPRPAKEQTPMSRAERHAAVSLAAAALAAWVAPFAGIAPWWPFTGAVAIALGLRGGRPQVVIPWRIATQIGAMLIVVSCFGLKSPAVPVGLLGLLAVAGAIAVVTAFVNNLPASVWAGTLLTGGSGYAASIGLAIGALATPQGSVATLIATDLAGDTAPRFPVLRLAPITVVALIAATLLVWSGL